MHPHLDAMDILQPKCKAIRPDTRLFVSPCPRTSRWGIPKRWSESCTSHRSVWCPSRTFVTLFYDVMCRVIPGTYYTTQLVLVFLSLERVGVQGVCEPVYMVLTTAWIKVFLDHWAAHLPPTLGAIAHIQGARAQRRGAHGKCQKGAFLAHDQTQYQVGQPLAPRQAYSASHLSFHHSCTHRIHTIGQLAVLSPKCKHTRDLHSLHNGIEATCKEQKHTSQSCQADATVGGQHSAHAISIFASDWVSISKVLQP